MNDTTPDGAAAVAARPTLPPPAPAQASPAAPASVQLLDHPAKRVEARGRRSYKP